MLPDNINHWYVRNASGAMTPLSAYSSTEWTYGSPRLERYNGQPAMEILGQPVEGKSSGDAMKFMASLINKLPAGVGYARPVCLIRRRCPQTGHQCCTAFR